MSVLRSLLFLLLMVVFTPIYITGLLCLFWLPLWHRHLLSRPWVRVTLWLVEHVLGIGYRVVGAENIPPGACIVLCKHQSAWETLALQKIFLGAVFVMKRELHWIPFFGWGLALNPMIAIDRAAGKDALRQVTEQGTQRLQAGYRVVVFPEGTRVAPGGKRRYKPGGAMLAVKSGFPVVPVALNSGEVWGRNALFKQPGCVTVHIGPPIDPAGLAAEEVLHRVEAWIEGEMRIISPDLYHEENSPATTRAAA
ncbi:MAG: 1-acyl-sn-glycerol-3-phosphate acyltransferase [Rhodocyclaceae bacterium]|jgi:1-acyl-sn-glycerol-3-phosphate acyltransferase|nr:1-acyl-sn-glycerol-3-phosphate acyltransferase [Rhodocyclaceae bacterium]